MKTKRIIFIWLMLLPCALMAQGSLGLAEGLPAGLYVLQAQTAQGALTQTRFVLAP